MPNRRSPNQPDDAIPDRVAWRDSESFVKALRELGLEIRRCREREKWTLEQAAEVMGLDYRHLAKIESGMLNPTAFTMFRIAQGLRISLDALAGGSASAAPPSRAERKEASASLRSGARGR